MTEDAALSKQCTRCEAELDATGFPLWCKACRAAYRREYNSLRKEMAETRGFAAGVGATRALFVGKFSALGHNTFSGLVAAEWVRTEPGPPLPE